MNEAIRTIAWSLTFILFAFAVVNLAIQFRDGVPWSEINWLLPLCVGGVGLGTITGEWSGAFDNSANNDIAESEGGVNSGEDGGGDSGI